MADVLIISGGNAEDLIGATLAKHLQAEVLALPLVGDGKRYEGVAKAILGPRKPMPSGGFPFNSPANLLADLRAGFIGDSLEQWRTARRTGPEVGAIAVVGDSYSLFVGCLAHWASQAPLFHLQPQVSRYYWGQRDTWERLRQLNQFGAEDYLAYERWMHRYVQAVYVRDRLSEARALELGLSKAKFVGSMAMDTLGPPERDIGPILDGRPVLVLLPGTRGDVGFSLPVMLETAALLPQMQPLVAWAGDFTEVARPQGWGLEVHSQDTASLYKEEIKVWLLRRAFSAILHQGRVAIGTAGTANEQAAGMGIPVVGFPTKGPQYLLPNALRQTRLLGQALKLVEAHPQAIAQAVRERIAEGPLRSEAQQAGYERNGPRGALPEIANTIHKTLRP